LDLDAKIFMHRTSTGREEGAEAASAMDRHVNDTSKKMRSKKGRVVCGLDFKIAVEEQRNIEVHPAGEKF
jgi:hypothetical protein